MDEYVSYDRAEGNVDSAIIQLDVSDLQKALQRFPVLQVHATNKLINKLPYHSISTKNPKQVHIIADIVGCILSPCGLSTESKLCALLLVYFFRNSYARIFRLLLQRMVVAKHDCNGCGLFVLTAVLEYVREGRNLPKEIKELPQTDVTELTTPRKETWKEVVDVLEKQRPTKSSDTEKGTRPQFSFLPTKKITTRLHLRTRRLEKTIKKRRRVQVTAVNRARTDELRKTDRHELFLKLVSLYIARPTFVAEKIRTHGLTSYCSAKVLALCKSLILNRCRFNADELQGIQIIGNNGFNPSLDESLVGLSTKAAGAAFNSDANARSGNGCPKEMKLNGLLRDSNHAVVQDHLDATLQRHGEVHLWPGTNILSGITNTVKHDRLLETFKVWMPLTVGIRSVVRALQNGQMGVEVLLNTWEAAAGKLVSSMDQIIIAALAHDHILENLLASVLFGQAATASGRLENSDSRGSAGASTVLVTARQLFRMLDQISDRGLGYATSFWEQVKRALTVLQSMVIWVLVHNAQETFTADVNGIITHTKNIEKQLQQVLHDHPTQPSTQVAVVKICDCLSVELKWKDKRRLRCSMWRSCRCMIPNTLFMRIPEPETWFSWCRTSFGMSDARGGRSLWLYRTSRWRGPCGYSAREVLRGLVMGVIRGNGEVCDEFEEIIKYLLGEMKMEELFAVLKDCSRRQIRRHGTMGHDSVLHTELHQIQVGIETMWLSVDRNLKQIPDPTGRGQQLACIEDLLTSLAPKLEDLHRCIRDMPNFCEHISEIFGSRSECDRLIRVPIVAGIVSSCNKAGVAGGLLESVMLCFR